MIYVTGDTHGTIDILKLQEFSKAHPDLTKEDFLIIAGDFGGVWDRESLRETLRIYHDFPFTTLFVDGNHENFDMLDAYPAEVWKGGKAHFISPDVIHLMRGQVFEIEDYTIFTFGGATSVDRAWRREGVSWWRQEVPTHEDLGEGIANLKRYQNTVDFIITHSCDEKALWYPPLRSHGMMMNIYPENQILSFFEDIVTYRHWYFGHYHLDGELNGKKTVLYQNIVKLGE